MGDNRLNIDKISKRKIYVKSFDERVTVVCYFLLVFLLLLLLLFFLILVLVLLLVGG